MGLGEVEVPKSKTIKSDLAPPGAGGALAQGGVESIPPRVREETEGVAPSQTSAKSIKARPPVFHGREERSENFS